ncbi:hypothetical protein NESM_000021800 [Novymonas esmeraldas]|uniref:Uncharacterized protein n=1 Tax=Novymonas esmeraldas TaxID=1808958 RepID=A0AAW0F1K3_9TRYP
MDTAPVQTSERSVTLPAEELRQALECILASASASAQSYPEEGRSLEVQRQRVLTLLARLDEAAPVSSDTTVRAERHQGALVSPPHTETGEEERVAPRRDGGNGDTAADLTGAGSDGAESEAAQRSGGVVAPPAHRCLLGNLFAQPRSSPEHVTWGDPRPDFHTTACSPPARGSTSLPVAVSPPDRHDDAGCRRLWPDRVCAGRMRGGRAASPSPRRCPGTGATVTMPHSFWINVWPCLGGSAASRIRHPTRVLVRAKCCFFEDVVEKAAELTQCRPAPHSLYTPDGCPIHELGGLVAESHYLLYPAGGFYRQQAVPTALLWLLYTDARHIVQHS